jgi:hypothetical protein
VKHGGDGDGHHTSHGIEGGLLFGAILFVFFIVACLFHALIKGLSKD